MNKLIELLNLFYIAMAKLICEGNFRFPKIPMKTDKKLHNNLLEPLSSIISGTCICISGASGSGKSNVLINLFTHKRCEITKKKRNLRNCFDNIVIVSPSMKSFNNDIFEDIEEKYKFTNLRDFLDSYAELLDLEGQTAVILDDVGSQIRKNSNIGDFSHMIHNRRHLNLSLFILVQNITMLHPSCRDSLNILIAFKCKSQQEKEYIFQLTGLQKKFFDNFYSLAFQQRHDCVFCDLTQSRSDDFEFYRNVFNKITIE